MSISAVPAANDNRPHTVQADIYVARRKRIHQIIDPAGLAVFSAPHILDVLVWLADKDLTTARFTDEETSFTVTFFPCSPEPPL